MENAVSNNESWLIACDRILRVEGGRHLGICPLMYNGEVVPAVSPERGSILDGPVMEGEEILRSHQFSSVPVSKFILALQLNPFR